MVLKIVSHYHLLHSAGTTVTFAGQHLAQDLPGSHDVAQADCRRQRLGEGADVQHMIGVVKGTDGVLPFTLKDQIRIALILEDGYSVLPAQAEHFPTSLHAHHSASGVLKGRNGIDIFGSNASLMQFL